MYLAKPMFEADLVINLPKLKTHSAGIYTGAFKNLFGCIPGLKKVEYHRLAPRPGDLGEIIADIHQSVPVGLHIMDGITAMQGEGPTAGEVYHAKKILLSTDPLALDCIALTMLGLTIDDVPMLITAKNRQIGQSTGSIAIAGNYTMPPVLPKFRYPKKLRSTRQRNDQVLVKVIDFLKTRPKINPKLCKHCNLCVESCPVHAIHMDKSIDYHLCIECMCCHELCIHQAVVLKKDNRIADLLTRLYRGRYR